MIETWTQETRPMVNCWPGEGGDDDAARYQGRAPTRPARGPRPCPACDGTEEEQLVTGMIVACTYCGGMGTLEGDIIDGPCPDVECVDGAYLADSMLVFGVGSGLVAYGRCTTCHGLSLVGR